MTNNHLQPLQPASRDQSTASLRSLAEALDKLVDDQTSYLHLQLPERTMQEIQETYTTGRWKRLGIADDGGTTKA
jgi:hypothetical protein